MSAYKDLDWVVAEGWKLGPNMRLVDVFVIGQVCHMPRPIGWNENETDIIPLMYFDKEYNILPSLASHELRIEQYETVKMHHILKPTEKDLAATKKRIQRSGIIRALAAFPEEIAANIASFIV